MGYYPQISFLCQKRNVFGTEEDVWIKLTALSGEKLKELEDRLIGVLKF